MTPEQLGRKIVERRKELNLTQKEVAEQIHVSPSTISKWERGKGYPDVSSIPELARVLAISVETLMVDKDATEISTVEQVLSIAINKSGEKEKSSRKKNVIFGTLCFMSVILLAAFLVPVRENVQLIRRGYVYCNNEKKAVEALISGICYRYLLRNDNLELEVNVTGDEDKRIYQIHAVLEQGEYWNSGGVSSPNSTCFGNFYFSPDFSKFTICCNGSQRGEEILILTDDRDYDFDKIKQEFQGAFVDRLVSMWGRPKDEIMECMGWNNAIPEDEGEQIYIIDEYRTSHSFPLVYSGRIVELMPEDSTAIKVFFANKECDAEQKMVSFEYSIDISGEGKNEIVHRTFELMRAVETEMNACYGEESEIDGQNNYEEIMENSEAAIRNMRAGEVKIVTWRLTSEKDEEGYNHRGSMIVQPIYEENTLVGYNITIHFERTIL